MIVYKATNNDMTCTMGQGTFQYELGVPATTLWDAEAGFSKQPQ